ncbi:MAG: MarR family transcriptional regulator [Calditrichaeota bacterium]|nr:MAG: MarR family transcriptional regulator [Calditrichota bacterium]MBL1206591.1 MarR family transcriptional regulator [Calditrichota bacterium]
MSFVRERLKQSKFDSLSHEAVLSILLASNKIKEMHNAACEKNAISYQHFNILRILKGVYPNGHPRCEISARMMDRSPDITRLISKLVKKKLVVRSKSTDDMRQSVAIITQKGINLLEEINSEYQLIGQQLETVLGEDDLKKIISICDRILTAE